MRYFMEKRELAIKIIYTLNQKGYAAYMVGGSVRDSYMGIEPYDYDIATSALPETVKKLFPKTIDTGLQHGTVTVIENHIPFEVTTFRTESTYKNHRAPESVQFVTDIKDDLMRRDFTVNAMAYHPEEGLIDPYGGKADISDKIIRCVGNPEERFEEDALRILRCIRFACKTDFSVHPETKSAMRKKSLLLQHISVERIYSELSKCLTSKYPEHLKLGYETGVFAVILPELHRCFLTEQNTKYHLYNVGDHIIKAVCACPPDKTVRFAAFLHDIAKPLCKTTDESGQDHFKGHEQKSAELATQILQKLISDVSKLIYNHRAQDYKKRYTVKQKIRAVGKDLFPAYLNLLDADTSAHNPQYNEPRIKATRYLQQIYTEIIQNNEPLYIKDLALSGNDLIAAGYQNSEIGQKLDELLEIVLQYPEKNTKEHLIERI